VTEDADLGLRLARAGYRVETFASHTFEEAPVTIRAWINQRSRWMKGWMQTAIVHCRRPDRLVADLGVRRAIAVVAMFASGFVGPLVGPLLTALFCLRAVYGDVLTPRGPIEVALSTLWCFLALAGAGAVLWPLVVAMERRRLRRFAPMLLLTPLWQILLGLAAWRALFELWTKPFFWRKTEHGHVRRAPIVKARAAKTQAA
jgi:cellulose synthase/poly-beta-1,6-N-acetylglucosamine synthase-like glycosyltransferase